MASSTPRNKGEVIQFVGVSDLTPDEQDVVNRITTESYEKIKRDLQNMTNMLVHMKTYDKQGDRKKYSIHVRIDAPTKHSFASGNADDWELPTVLHKAFDDVRAQIRHRLHSDISRPRDR